MTQEEVDLVYSITIAMYEHPWFKEKSRTRDEVQNWVREKLSAHGILTVPSGMAWESCVVKNDTTNTVQNMQIRSALSAELIGWNIIITDDTGKRVHYIAIPPTTKDRIDVFVETRGDDGFTIQQKYLYNFLGNLKKLKGEKLVITIKAGKVCITK